MIGDTKPGIKYVVEITLAYEDPEKAPGLHNLCLGLHPQIIRVPSLSPYFQSF